MQEKTFRIPAVLLYTPAVNVNLNAMIRHYIRIAVRNLERQKMLAFINIVGLSIGIACFTLFLLYAVHEFSYDRFHKNASSIYRIYSWWATTPNQKTDVEGNIGSEPASTTPLGPAMKSDLADVEDFVRIQHGGEKLVRIKTNVQQIRVSFADPQLFSVFTFPALSGNPATGLRDPFAVAITRTKALQLFGDVNAVGKQLEIKTDDQYETFTVAAVVEDIPTNSTIRFDILGSFEYVLRSPMGKQSNDDWHMTIGISVYVKLRPGSTLMNDPERLFTFRQKYFPEEAAEITKAGTWNGKDPYPYGYGLQPMTDVHTNVQVDPWGSVNPRNIWILVAIAGCVLLIACINFIILAIGRSSGRLKEVGVRKVIGSLRKQLVVQFLAESLMLALCSALLGLGIAQTMLPLFNDLAGTSLSFSLEQYPEVVPLFGTTVLVVGLLSGFYPALILSGFRPVEALKNKVRIGGSNFFTKSLVTLQFILSVALIIGTIVILQQLSYMREKDLGFRKENIVMIAAGEADTRKVYPLFREALMSNTNILGISSSVMGLGAGEGQMGRAYRIQGELMGVIEYPVDPYFFNTMGMSLIEGRNFDATITSDTISSVIVNESLAHALAGENLSQVLGMELKVERSTRPPRTIIGVAKDFNFEDLTRTVRPQLFLQSKEYKPTRFFVRIKPGDPQPALDLLKTTWRRVAPQLPFTYSFVDEKFDAFYRAEERWSTIVGWAGNICVFLACLGLFGLASLSVANRTKEIGIRKVLGASVISVVRLLCHDFVQLVLIAIVIAGPLAWYVMNMWLQHFAYKVNLKWWVFALTGFLALMIAIFTVSSQAIRAALMNPVKSLKSE